MYVGLILSFRTISVLFVNLTLTVVPKTDHKLKQCDYLPSRSSAYRSNVLYSLTCTVVLLDYDYTICVVQMLSQVMVFAKLLVLLNCCYRPSTCDTISLYYDSHVRYYNQQNFVPLSSQ